MSPSPISAEGHRGPQAYNRQRRSSPPASSINADRRGFHDRSFSSEPTAAISSLDVSFAPSDGEATDINNQYTALSGKAHNEFGYSQSPVLPESVLSALRLFESLRSLKNGPGTDQNEQEDTELQEIDISPEEYCLLRWLLGQEIDLYQERALASHQEELFGNISTYLQLLREAGLRCCCSVEELCALGLWVLDFVRYDFVSVYDDAATEQVVTRLYVRMPLHIHDMFAFNMGQLLFQRSIAPVLANKDVHAFPGFKCRFTNKFYQMMQEEKATRRSARPMQVPGPGNPPMDAQPQQDSAQGRPQAHTRSQTILEPVVPSAKSSQDSRAENEDVTRIDSVAHFMGGSEREERLRYEEANPDVCIYIGDENTTVVPSIIIEVGFSHPLPFDRARSYIYGSHGQCRVVVCLDIKYRDRDSRLESYRNMVSVSSSSEVQDPRPPPYELTLHLFWCKIKNKAGQATYAARHELKYINVRELARLGQALKLSAADLLECDDKGEVVTEVDPMEGEGRASHEGVQDTIEIPYAEMVRLLDEASWGQAVRDEPSLQPTGKRKRVLVARSSSSSPEVDAEDAS